MEFESGRCSALTSADLSWASHFPLVLNSTGGNFTRKFLLLRSLTFFCCSDIGLAIEDPAEVLSGLLVAEDATSD